MLVLALLISCALAGPPLRILFKNAGSLSVSELYIQIAGSKNRGSERLQGKTIAPKGKMQFLLEDGADECVVDLKLQTVEGKAFSYRARLCEDHTFTFRGRLQQPRAPQAHAAL
ncbi:MAG: hypothetical protein JWQ89_969 [Devosia sp.]|nr:hypothetical protein [Devosia sp.]